jgi:hypothetical protein
MKKPTFLLALLSISLCGFSQNDWMTFPVKSDTVQRVKIDSLNYTEKEGSVEIIGDDRLDILDKFVRSGEESIEGVLVDGYRILIYFDQDKSKSEQQKSYFMNMYSEHTAYIDYLAPNYRVRVGNFRTKLEAEHLKQEILSVFPTAIVVSDKISLPVLPVE